MGMVADKLYIIAGFYQLQYVILGAIFGILLW